MKTNYIYFGALILLASYSACKPADKEGDISTAGGAGEETKAGNSGTDDAGASGMATTQAEGGEAGSEAGNGVGGAVGGSGGAQGVPINEPVLDASWLGLATIGDHILVAGNVGVRPKGSVMNSQSCTAIAEYEPSGLRNWFQCLGLTGGPFQATATTLGVDADDGVYVAGPSGGIARVSAAGDTLWVGAISDPWVNASKQLPAEEQSADLHLGQLDPVDKRFSRLLAFDKKGVMKWSTPLGHDGIAPGAVTFQGPACDANGACRVIATYKDSEDDPTDFHREIQSLDADGNLVSAKRVELECDPPYAMFVVPSSGDLYVGADCLAKIDAAGKVAWYKSLAPAATRQFAVSKDGSAIYVALSQNQEGGVTLARYDQAGQTVWSTHNARYLTKVGESPAMAVDSSNTHLYTYNQELNEFSTADGSDLGSIPLH